MAAKLWAASRPLSVTAQLSEMALAPARAASACAAARSEMLSLSASTSTMRQLGHRADTASRSSEVSSPQPVLVVDG